MSRPLETRPRSSSEWAQKRAMTYEEFLEWADEDTLAEWVDGVVIRTYPATLQHQKIAWFIFSILSTFAEIHFSGTLLNRPFQMKLARSGREPDVLFIATENLARLKRTYLDGPADLVVEIISPESEDRDRSSKFYEYQDAGVLEYWLIDPELEQANFYQLDATGHYQQVVPDEAGRYRSRVLPGFWLRAAWLWQDPLLSPIQALLEIDYDAYSRHLQEHLRRAEQQRGETTSG